jgi:hypothetical protein
MGTQVCVSKGIFQVQAILFSNDNIVRVVLLQWLKKAVNIHEYFRYNIVLQEEGLNIISFRF